MTGFNWVLDQGKFLRAAEVKRLIRTAEGRAEKAITNGRKVAVRDYFIVHLALATGLRAIEMARLKCGDVFLDDYVSSLIVRNGKGGKKRVVSFNRAFKLHYEQYIRWKTQMCEPTEPGDPLLLSSNTGGHMTTRALQKAFKRCAKRAGISRHYSIHSLRHTYGSGLYQASGYNLRLVQKQLGHANTRITEVYADVMNPDLITALEKLYL